MDGKTSANSLGVFAQILAVLCMFLFVATALMALIAFNIEQHAFNPVTYQRALNNENFYQQLPMLMGDMIVKSLGNDVPPFAKVMSAENWKVFIEDLLPPEKLKAMTDDAITQLFAYINGETLTPYISFTPLKQSLASANGLNAALTILKARPNCTVEQLALMVTSFGQELCNPPEKMLELAAPFIRTQLQAVAASIPDQVQMAKADVNQQTRIQTLKTIRMVIRLSPLIPLALLFAITLLAVRSLRGWLTWWGWPLLLTGLPGAIIGFAGAPFLRRNMERAIAIRIPITFSSEMTSAITKVVDASLREMLRHAGWEGLFLFITGTIMVLVAFHLGQKEKDQLQASEAPTQIFWKKRRSL